MRPGVSGGTNQELIRIELLLDPTYARYATRYWISPASASEAR